MDLLIFAFDNKLCWKAVSQCCRQGLWAERLQFVYCFLVHIHGPYGQALHGNKLSIIFFQHENRVVKGIRAAEKNKQNLILWRSFEVWYYYLPHLLYMHILESGLYALVISQSELFHVAVKQKLIVSRESNYSLAHVSWGSWGTTEMTTFRSPVPLEKWHMLED